jgi:hypothetical protein
VPPGTPDAAMAQTGTEKKKKKFLHLTFKQCHLKLTVGAVVQGFAWGNLNLSAGFTKIILIMKRDKIMK